MAKLVANFAIFCVFGQFAFAQRHVAEDITEQITAAEVDFARQAVADCLAGQVIDLVSDYSAYSTERGQSLHLVFDWREHGPKQRLLFSAELYRGSPRDTWVLGRIMTTGEMIAAGQNDPIHIAGYLESKLVDQLVVEANNFWTEAAGTPFEIIAISSNQNVPTYCDVEGSEFDDAHIVFDIAIRNLAPRKSAPPTASPNTVALGSYSSNDNSYVVRFSEDNTDRLISTEIECLGGGACDPELLVNLQGGLDRPVSQSDIDNRLRAAMEVVPTEFSAAKVRNTHRAMFGPYELFTVQFDEVSISPRRTELSSVNCGRAAGTDEAWQCTHRRSAGNQFVKGQTTPVSLMLAETLPESTVDAIVDDLRRELAIQLEIDTDPDGIRFFTISVANVGYHASFIHGRATFTALFEFDGESVQVSSVEVDYRMDEDVP